MISNNATSPTTFVLLLNYIYCETLLKKDSLYLIYGAACKDINSNNHNFSSKFNIQL
jgi:hypothetical protein